jgi:hypothetical protein
MLRNGFVKMPYYKEGIIVEINGQYVTIDVYKGERKCGKVTLPVIKPNLLDIAANWIGEKIKFDTENGKISVITSR